MKLTPGKLKGMKAVSNNRGVVAAAAMDQRGSLKKALWANAGDKELEAFKTAVTEILTPHASAIGAEYLDLYFEQLTRELAQLP